MMIFPDADKPEQTPLATESLRLRVNLTCSFPPRTHLQGLHYLHCLGYLLRSSLPYLLTVLLAFDPKIKSPVCAHLYFPLFPA